LPGWFELIRQFQWLDHLHRGALCITLSDAFDIFYLFYQFHKSSYDLTQHPKYLLLNIMFQIPMLDL